MSLYEKTKAKEIIVDKKEIESTIKDTIYNMAELVGSTLGPAGRTVLIERDNLSPLVTKDGVTVAKNIGYLDSKKNVFVESAKEICLNTGKEAGDGTTSAIVLASSFIKRGYEYLQELGKEENPQAVSRSLLKVYEKEIKRVIKEYSKDITTPEEIKNIAMVSSNGDEVVSDVVLEATNSAGNDGHIVIAEDLGGETRCENIEGYIVTSSLKNLGALGTKFINDRGTQECKMDNGLILMYNGEINDHTVLSNLQELISKNNNLAKVPFVIMAHNFSDSVMEQLVKFFMSGFSILPIKTPHFATPTSRTIFLEDMAAYTGGKVVDPGFEELTIQDFGSFEKIRANVYECIVYPEDAGSEESNERIQKRIKELNAICDAATSEFDKSIIKGCISRISGGVSTIYVGGITELEIREKKARAEDAVEAVRSAISEGIVPGGATIYLAIKKELECIKTESNWDIIINSLDELIDRILSNAGIQNKEAIIKKLYNNIDIDKKEINMIYNANTRSVEKFSESKIIDPSKVIRVALGNALSVATMFLTLGGIVVVPRDLNAEMQTDLQKTAFQEMMGSLNNA
jgi:chaperonin GroEL